MVEKISMIIEADLCYNQIKMEYALTRREIEIVKHINYYGLNNRELALRLGITEKTVKNHIGNILEKTSMISTRQLQAMVFRKLINTYMHTFHA